MDVDFGDIQQTGGGGGGGDGGGGGGGDDITSELLQKFSCMNTTDREVLIQQFKVLLGEKCSESSAEFWLDMNNWNLQAAVCSYFDYESQNSSAFMIKLPSMSFVADPQFVDRMPPNAPFVYRCILTNSGDETWPLGCSLRFCGGTQMTNEERVLLPTLVPGQSAEVKLSMIAPENGGGHSCQWRPATITGQFFGETIFIIVNVIADDSLLQAVTRQLSDAHLGVINSAGGELSTTSSAEAAAAAASTTTTTTSTSILNFDSPFSPSTTSACVPCTTSPLLLSSSSSSSSSSNFASLPAFRANLITAPSTAIALPAPNRFSNWMPGMCIPGSTAAGYLPHPQPDQQQPQMIEQQPQQPQQSTGTLPNGFVSYDHTHHSPLSYSHQHQPNQQQHSNNDSMDNDDNDDDDNLIRSETTTAPASTREQITSLSSPPLSSTTTSSSSSSSSASTINHHQQHQHQHQFPLALTHIPNSSSNQQQQMNPNFDSSLCSTNAITNLPTTTATPSLSSNIIMINGATSNAATLATSIADEDIGEDSFMS